MLHRLLSTRTLTALLLLAALAACDAARGPFTPEADHDLGPPTLAASMHAANSAEIQRWLAGLRGATAAFHQFDHAVASGYDTPITGCMELPGTGGMGYHYGNLALLDGVVEAFRPEVLLYEPQKNGRMRLVAVEYIVPFVAWAQPTPPQLHGVSFHPVAAFQVWALHAWVWQHNPDGMFADWNPRVSCAHAP